MVYRRVIEFDVDKGNVEQAKGLIDQALDSNIALSLESPRAQSLLAQIKSQRESKTQQTANRTAAAPGARSAEEPSARQKRGSTVAMVKNGNLIAYPNVPVGKAVDAFLADPRWEAVQGNDGHHYVNVQGKAQYANKIVRIVLQFRVDIESGTFEVNALEMNDLPQIGLMQAVLLNKIFEDYSN